MTDPVFKAFSVVSKALDIEQGIFEATISTEAVDRQGDIVRATGAKPANFLKNPVVLWAHNYYEPPVARALSVEILPGEGLKSVFQFPDWKINPQADIIRQLWAGKFLNATSIGFIPLKSKPIDESKDEDYWWGPRDYVEWELLEYSIVPVPANQEALRLALRSLTPKPEQKTPFLSKRGRVLSAANERKLRDAAEAITSVLSQLEGDDPQEESLPAPEQTKSDPGDGDGTPAPVTDPDTQSPNTDPTSNDWDESVLESLSELFDVLTGA